MNTQTAIIPCRGNECDRKLRVPTGRGRLKVTCPECRTTWEWAPAGYGAETAEVAGPTRLRKIIVAATALLLACGVWNRAWTPSLLFLLAVSVWWACGRKASAGREETLLRKGSGAVWEAAGSVAGAAATGFAAVLGLVTFLNSYAGLTPSRYPSWLPALEDGLVKLSARLEDSNNKTLVSLTYVFLILLCVVATAVARRQGKEWKPVKRLSRWKQRLTKAAVALQAFTFFTFFAQSPINAHALELERGLRWRYGVAKRAEQQLDTKRLLAEQLRDAALDPDASKEDRDAFSVQIADLRPGFRPRPAPPAADGPGTHPPSPPPGGSPPGGPRGWRPPSWPRPPEQVRDKLDKGKPLTPDDYGPTRKTEPSASGSTRSGSTAEREKAGSEGQVSWEAKAEKVVVARIDDSAPPDAGVAAGADQTPPDPAEGMVWPIKTAENWEQAKEQVAAQEAKANEAERIYGQAVQGALEAVCEYAGLQINADPLVGAWIDLTINNLADRVHAFIFRGEPTARAVIARHLRRLLSPRENAAEKLADGARARIGASDYDAAERLVGELLRNYPNTKASKQARGLAEQYTFERIKASYRSSAWGETIRLCSDYLDEHYDASRSQQVRDWLNVSKRQKAADDLDARTPRMIVYVRVNCGNSKYFREVTSQEAVVRSELGRFRYELRDLDKAPLAEQMEAASTGQEILPVILFKNRAGELLNSIGGSSALDPAVLTAKMRAVLAGRRETIVRSVLGSRLRSVLGGGTSACSTPLASR